MNNHNITYWRNYQNGIEWSKQNTLPHATIPVSETIDEDEMLEFGIDDELLEFYRLSRNHKEIRKNEKAKEKDETEQYELIVGEQMQPNVHSISKLPPVNRSKLRQLELEWLYGQQNSAKIQTRETQLQMEFDQIFDKRQPPYFPSLPNRLNLEPHLHGRHNLFPTISISDLTK